jgi:hypothetical protein
MHYASNSQFILTGRRTIMPQIASTLAVAIYAQPYKQIVQAIEVNFISTSWSA